MSKNKSPCIYLELGRGPRKREREKKKPPVEYQVNNSDFYIKRSFCAKLHTLENSGLW